MGDRGPVFSGLVGIIIAGGEAGGLFKKLFFLPHKITSVPARGHMCFVVVIIIIDWLILKG